MMNFETLNVSEEIKSSLRDFEVDFVFQPIYCRDGALYGHEALMRPRGSSIEDFIRKEEKAGRLHDLELLSFFGATMAYRERHLQNKLSINSFPAECFTEKEAKAYSECFRPIKDKLIIEILEYTDKSEPKWKTKHTHVNTYSGIEIALDDFGTGNNSNLKSVNYYCPDYVKLDRSMISNVDRDIKKQKALKQYVNAFHAMGIKVLAEGIEKEEEYNFLYGLNVDYFQGYYFGQPA